MRRRHDLSMELAQRRWAAHELFIRSIMPPDDALAVLSGTKKAYFRYVEAQINCEADSKQWTRISRR